MTWFDKERYQQLLDAGHTKRTAFSLALNFWVANAIALTIGGLLAFLLVLSTV